TRAARPLRPSRRAPAPAWVRPIDLVQGSRPHGPDRDTGVGSPRRTGRGARLSREPGSDLGVAGAHTQYTAAARGDAHHPDSKPRISLAVQPSLESLGRRRAASAPPLANAPSGAVRAGDRPPERGARGVSLHRTSVGQAPDPRVPLPPSSRLTPFSAPRGNSPIDETA